MVSSKKKGDHWSNPKILNISGRYQDIEPFLSMDKNRIYFASNRPIYNDTSRSDYNIWFSNREGENWSQPEPLDSSINSKGNEFYPSLSSNGNLYFTATRNDGIGSEDIFMSNLVNGIYQTPRVLPRAINSSTYEFNAFISPDEQFIIFSSYGRKDGFGGGDLYISKKDAMGKWQEAKNLGPKINSNKLDYCPFVDSQKQFLYFTSERVNSKKDSIRSIEELKLEANKIENGFGNIYRIGFDLLK
ncbi:MAG: sialidase family protein [Bacteroidota bacterium]